MTRTESCHTAGHDHDGPPDGRARIGRRAVSGRFHLGRTVRHLMNSPGFTRLRTGTVKTPSKLLNFTTREGAVTRQTAVRVSRGNACPGFQASLGISVKKSRSERTGSVHFGRRVFHYRRFLTTRLCRSEKRSWMQGSSKRIPLSLYQDPLPKVRQNSFDRRIPLEIFSYFLDGPQSPERFPGLTAESPGTSPQIFCEGIIDKG